MKKGYVSWFNDELFLGSVEDELTGQTYIFNIRYTRETPLQANEAHFTHRTRPKAKDYVKFETSQTNQKQVMKIHLIKGE